MLMMKSIMFPMSAFLIMLAAAIVQPQDWPGLLILVAVLVSAISSSVHSADAVAKRLGSSAGTLILAFSVTVIEVALILSLMGNQGEAAATIARDTVFATIMIVTNGTLGMCLLVGGLMHRDLDFRVLGTSSLMSALVPLTIFTFVLPNFTTSTVGPSYTQGQLVFVSAIALAGYAALLWAQTKSRPEFFTSEIDKDIAEFSTEFSGSLWTDVLGLAVSLGAVVGLAKNLSPSIETWVISMGAPPAIVGIIVAVLVLSPETLSAIGSAKINRLQESVNLALGSAVASIALTIPAVSIYSIVFDRPLNLGLEPKGMVMLFMTFLTGAMTLGSGRATFLHGLVHIGILAGYVALTIMP
jgi:Ca2+:H+ antiporter